VPLIIAHLILGVHPTVQPPLHRAFRDRRRDWRNANKPYLSPQIANEHNALSSVAKLN
jgi:hypothetical protein